METLNGKSHTESEISNLKQSKTWKTHHKHLRKDMCPSSMINQHLEEWFSRHKCTASPGQAPAGGRFDPKTKKPLFGPDTKEAVQNNKKTSCCSQDVPPLKNMCRRKDPPKRSKRDVHDSCTCKSDRGENRLEAFHDEEANMANTNMRESLADSIHLEGTSTWNMQVRERNRFDSLPADERSKVPSFFHGEPLFFNESDLAVVNSMATKVGVTEGVHPNAHPLPEDNGERFFAACFREQQKRNADLALHPLNTRCQCMKCAANPVQLPEATAQPPEAVRMVVQQPERKKASEKRKAGAQECILAPPSLMAPIFPNPDIFWKIFMPPFSAHPLHPMMHFQLSNLCHHQQQQMMAPLKLQKRQEEHWCDGCFKWNIEGRRGRRPKA